MNEYTCDDIKQHLENGAHLIDVRTTDEHSNGALPQSVNIPLNLLPVVADERLDADAPIFIYCQSGGRAIMAEKILKNMGYENCRSIGGIQQYQHCH